MDKLPLLSIVIPVYNESARLPKTLCQVFDYLRQQPYSSQLVVVDDGSSDNTIEVAEEFSRQHRNVLVIKSEHRGKGYAVRTGVLTAVGKYILFSDADLAVPMEEFERFLPYLRSGYDIVIASREGDGGRRIDEPVYRHVMGRIFNLIVRFIALDGFQDTQCGFKAFKRSVAKNLFSSVLLYDGNAKQLKGSAVTGFDVEILFLAIKYGYKVKEVPVRWIYGAEAKVNLFCDTWRNFMDVVRVRWYDMKGLYNYRSSNLEKTMSKSRKKG